MNQKSTDVNSEKRRPGLGPEGTEPKTILVLRLLSSNPQEPERVLKFDKERIVLGSVVSADVRLTGDGISPIHAVLELRKKSPGEGKENPVGGVIFDLASLSGVFVNGKKVVTQSLHDQDKITLGRYHLKYSLEIYSPEPAKKSQSDRTRVTEGRLLFLDPKEDLQPLLLQDEREIEEIFDFRPTSKRALEVVMSWYGSILDVEHFVHEKKVTVGNTSDNDFSIPPLLSSAQFPMVMKSRGEGFVLNIDSQMKGVIQQNGQLSNLDEVRGHASRGTHGYEVPLGSNDFAKIAIGEVDFYFSYTAAPPRLKRRRIIEKDAFFNKVFVISMTMTAALLFTLFKVQLPQNVEVEQMPERIATILYEPEKFMKKPEVPKPKPKAPEPDKKAEAPKLVEQKKPPVKLEPKAVDLKKPAPKMISASSQVKAVQAQAKPKPAQPNRPAPKAEGKEGEGARAKGTEGTRGELNQKKTNIKANELSRPTPNGGASGANTTSEGNEDGNIDLLKGAGGAIGNLLSSSTTHLGKGGTQVKGFGNRSTGGSGGLALSGNGQGGGGTADTTLGGLGKKGTGGGRVGTGKGAAGSGEGLIGAHSKVELRTDGPFSDAGASGNYDLSGVMRAIKEHYDEFKLCYNQELNAEAPSLKGEILAEWTIGASGRVSAAGVKRSSLHNSAVEGCVIKVLKRIQFPPVEGGGELGFTFPFEFNSNH